MCSLCTAIAFTARAHRLATIIVACSSGVVWLNRWRWRMSALSHGLSCQLTVCDSHGQHGGEPSVLCVWPSSLGASVTVRMLSATTVAN